MENALSAPPVVVGYHGCTRSVAEQILAERQFRASENTFDWLGQGAYFWEYAPYRALEWAQSVSALQNDEPAVVEATIHLGFAINLLDTKHIAGLAQTYTYLADALPDLPRNTLRGAHFLDRLVIDAYSDYYQERYNKAIQTVRGGFPEGTPIFNGSRILSKTHVQIAVRDLTCISGIRLVEF